MEDKTTVQPQIACYPNPVTDFVTITLSNDNIYPATVRITNELGTVVYDDIASNNRLRIDTQSLLTGTYYCNVIAGNYAGTAKFIIVR